MPDLLQVLELLPFVASCVSAVASAYLLAGLRRLPAGRRSKLLARQLTHLAAADLVYAAVQVPWWILNTGIADGWTLSGVPEGLRNPFCFGIVGLNAFGSEASLIFECHLALAFAASVCKSSCALQALSRYLAFTWVLAAILAVATPAIAQPFWAVDPLAADSTSCGTLGRDWTNYLTILAVFLVCLICYIMSVWHVWRHSGAVVQDSVGARARFYLLSAVLTGGPLAVYDSLPDTFFTSDPARIQLTEWWFVIASTAFNISGLLHFAIYALQCRRAQRLRVNLAKTHAEERRGDSFVVTFRNLDSVQELSPQQSQLSESPRSMTNSALEASMVPPTIPEQGGKESSSNFFCEEWTEISWLTDAPAPHAFYKSPGLQQQRADPRTRSFEQEDGDARFGSGGSAGDFRTTLVSAR